MHIHYSGCGETPGISDPAVPAFLKVLGVVLGRASCEMMAYSSSVGSPETEFSFCIGFVRHHCFSGAGQENSDIFTLCTYIL